MIWGSFWCWFIKNEIFCITQPESNSFLKDGQSNFCNCKIRSTDYRWSFTFFQTKLCSFQITLLHFYPIRSHNVTSNSPQSSPQVQPFLGFRVNIWSKSLEWDLKYCIGECIDTSTFEQLVISLFWILFQNSVHLESFLNPFLIALQIFLTFALKTLFNTNSYTTCTLSENMPEGLSVTKSIQFYLENGNSKRFFGNLNEIGRSWDSGWKWGWEVNPNELFD